MNWLRYPLCLAAALLVQPAAAKGETVAYSYDASGQPATPTLSPPHPCRFLQADPVGYDDQFNLYTYVANDPVNLTDPTGMCTENMCPVSAIWGSTEYNLQVRHTESRAAEVTVPVFTSILGGPVARYIVQRLLASPAESNSGRTASTSANTERTARNAPNPHGSRGAPDHQADVRGPGREQARAQAGPGEEVLTEEPLREHTGVSRRPDNQIVGRDGRTRLVVESERRPNGAYNRQRVEDYRRCGIECQIRPLGRRPRDGQ